MTLEEQVEEEQEFEQYWEMISKNISLLDQSEGLTYEELKDYGQHFLKETKIDGQKIYVIENPVDKTMSFSFIKIEGKDGEILYRRVI